MAERLDRAVVETLRCPARIAETNRHLVNDLLAFVRERGRQLGHIGLPSQDGLKIYPATAHLPCRPGGGIASRGIRSAVTSESFAADVKSETMAITDPGNPDNIGKSTF